ncbi:hypothetical protein [Allofournierella massiliensis]|uniref:Uncharacterized protein n=1 Tax=Allofournierella massiliensis TaxID=1650663 RepID=A0ABT7UPN3_9FIRM|nr:hypothetical protein [Fournierella massiliensis]MDM8200852.1 hypothetical protein [Fournierella massiliensis]
MPDSQDYKSAMDKVTAGQRWKQATLEKMQAETGAQKASRPRRTIPFGRRAIPLATAAAICLLVIPAAARSLTSVSGGATAADQASPRVATRQMPESSADAANGAVPFALAAAPEATMAEAPQDTAAAPAYTTVESTSPEAALPAEARPAEEAEGLDAALDQLDEILAAEGEGRTRSDVLASGLVEGNCFVFVLAGDSETSYRLYQVPCAQ